MIAVVFHVDVLRLIGLGIVVLFMLLLAVAKWLDGRPAKVRCAAHEYGCKRMAKYECTGAEPTCRLHKSSCCTKIKRKP